MNWEAVGALAELLGALAVIASLIYLATQVRQNTAQSLADSYQSRAQTSVHIFGELAMAHGLPEIQAKASALGMPGDSSKLGELTPPELYKLDRFFTALANHFDNIHFQYERGLIPKDYYEDVFLPGIAVSAEWWRALGIIGKGVLNRTSFKRQVMECLAKKDRSSAGVA